MKRQTIKLTKEQSSSIRLWRESRQLTRETLARLVGTSTQTIKELECRQKPISSLLLGKLLVYLTI